MKCWEVRVSCPSPRSPYPSWGFCKVCKPRSTLPCPRNNLRTQQGQLGTCARDAGARTLHVQPSPGDWALQPGRKLCFRKRKGKSSVVPVEENKPFAQQLHKNSKAPSPPRSQGMLVWEPRLDQFTRVQKKAKETLKEPAVSTEQHAEVQ